MARSVSVPCNAVKVAYAHFPDVMFVGEDNERPSDSDDFQSDLEYMQEWAIEKYPSLRECDSWLGNEDHVVLENKLCQITISEYCGLVAVAVVPMYDECCSIALAKQWASKVDVDYLAGCFGERLISQGRFSNGEQIFQPANGVQKGDLGIGFTSKEGWL